ncbi:MAG: CDGSH iron-sulfur domain-containing protein [Bacteroidales bacterium]|nr:CDGSH iron-sulfur domain-containing protein [Bacteroidales bacterium]
MDRKKHSETVIEVIDNGPLKITGKISFSDQKRGVKSDVEEIYLCRCGKSSTKPYCDGTHKRQ